MAKFFTPSRISDNIRETPEGYLLCVGVPIARTGWQEYGPGETPLEVGDDGLVWVHRESDEVFRPQTIASFNGKSVTIKHPNDFVEPKNWKMLTHGVVQNVRKGDDKDDDGEEQLIADLLITDDFAIGLVQNGLREVSCGYDAEYEQTDEGQGRQFNIIGNHIALVEQGRAGSAYAIKDHKGESDMNLKELAEKLKSLGKTVDQALAAKDEAAEKLKKKKETKTGDATPEQICYDDLMKAVKDIGDKVDALAGGKGAGEKMGDEEEKEEKPMDEEPKKEEKPAEDEEEKMEDSDEDQEVGQNSRLDKLEAAVAKILKALGNKNAEDEEKEDDDMSGSEDEDMEESEDADMEESEDAAEEEKSEKKTGDAALFEILTPGKKYKGKDSRLQCLKEFSKSEEGKEVLSRLGIKKPVFDAKMDSNTIFLASAALVKNERGVGLQDTKDSRKWKAEDVANTSSSGKTAEQLNEINAKLYSSAK